MKKFTNENLTKALSEGAIQVLRLNKEDCFLLAIIAKDKNYLIPLIKEGSCRAYINDSVSESEYDMLETIIKTIFESKIYSGLHNYKPMLKTYEVADKTIKGLVFTTLVNKLNKDLPNILLKNGYNIEEILSTEEKETIPMEYSELLKDPEVNKRFLENREELQKLNISYKDLSVETKKAYEALSFGDNSKGIIFAGPTGTGKSFAARILADKSNAPLLNLQISYGTTVEDLVGQFIPDESGASKWKFVMGPLLKAAVYGYQIVIEEVNFGQPGVISKLNEFTDGTLYVTVNGNIYKKHPNFVVYMTMNPGYKGTETLNVALKNRFSIINVPALNEEQFCKRSMAYSKARGHELSYQFFSKLFTLAGVLEKEGNSSRYHEDVKFSIRNAQRFVDGIVNKPQSFEEFCAVFNNQYINALSVDNDNSEKIEQLKKSEDIVSDLKELYCYYDLVKLEEAETKSCFDDFFTEIEESSKDSSSGEYGEDELNKLFGKFE